MERRGTIATREWRPQAFGPKHARDIVDAIVEPLWAGDRALLVVIGPETTPAFLDVDGEPYDDPLLEPIVADLEASLRADTIVLDGYLTRQPNVKAERAFDFGPAIPSHGEMLGQMLLGRTGGRAVQAVSVKETEPIDPDLPLSFVAVDLLAIDDQPLLDIPLLERKRILESAFEEADHLRLGVYVRPPIGSWLPGWRAFGFREVAYKAANSRYTPGKPNPGWATAVIPNR